MTSENYDFVAKVSIGAAFTAALTGFGFWIYKRCFADSFLKGSSSISEPTPIISNSAVEGDLKQGYGNRIPHREGNRNIYNSYTFVGSIASSSSPKGEVSRDEFSQLAAEVSNLKSRLVAQQKAVEGVAQFLLKSSLRVSEVLVEVLKDENEMDFLSEEKHEKFKILANNDLKHLSELTEAFDSNQLQSELKLIVTNFTTDHQMTTLGSNGYSAVEGAQSGSAD